jgi:hypothetical protein
MPFESSRVASTVRHYSADIDVGLRGCYAVRTSAFSPEEGDSMFLQNVGACLQSMRRHNLEEHHRNLYLRENLKSHKLAQIYR